MKIIIASTIIPFIDGGGLFIADWLCAKLLEYGHQAEICRLPFCPYWRDMPEQMLALRLLHFEEYGDRLICVRTPSYLIKHPSKFIWFIHHHRPMYDLMGSQYQDVPNTKEGLEYRQCVIDADNKSLFEAKKVYSNSKVMSERLMKFNKIKSEVVYPPLINEGSYYCDKYGDYIFYPSRLCQHKRQQLVIQAMKYTKSNVKLVIAGNPDNTTIVSLLEKEIEENDLTNKVTLITRWITHEEKIKYIAESLACAYTPLDEDSYGYVTLESFQSHKAVITCADSGGTIEIVTHGKNGYIVDSRPQEIAEVFDELFINKTKAKRMGDGGFDSIKSHHVSWDNVIKKFTMKI